MTLRRLAVLVGLLAVIATAVAAYGSYALRRQGARPTPALSRPDDVALLRESTGTFAARIAFVTGGGAKGAELIGEGLETRTLTSDGRWLIRQLDGTLGGERFSVVMTMGLSVKPDRYIGSWADSRTTGVALFQGTYDAARGLFSANFRAHASYGDAPLVTLTESRSTESGTQLEIGAQQPGGAIRPILRVLYDPAPAQNQP